MVAMGTAILAAWLPYGEMCYRDSLSGLLSGNILILFLAALFASTPFLIGITLSITVLARTDQYRRTQSRAQMWHLLATRIAGFTGIGFVILAHVVYWDSTRMATTTVLLYLINGGVSAVGLLMSWLAKRRSLQESMPTVDERLSVIIGIAWLGLATVFGVALIVMLFFG
jgi:uncharacterized membrane protein